jgi:inner membrane protein
VGRSLGLKLAAMGALIAALLIALMGIGSLVKERQERRDGVVREIANSSSLESPASFIFFPRPSISTAT